MPPVVPVLYLVSTVGGSMLFSKWFGFFLFIFTFAMWGGFLTSGLCSLKAYAFYRGLDRLTQVLRTILGGASLSRFSNYGHLVCYNYILEDGAALSGLGS